MFVPQAFTLGLISDTHGLLREEALHLLAGVDHIVHAGDIGDPSILERLAALAPVTAIRGNNDDAPWAEGLSETVTITLGGVLMHVVHSVNDLELDPSAKGVRVVISGHSHKPAIDQRGDVLFINPGSAGKRRFSLPLSVGRLVIEGSHLHPSILPITVPASSPARRKQKLRDSGS